jgi:hypothetical protein
VAENMTPRCPTESGVRGGRLLIPSGGAVIKQGGRFGGVDIGRSAMAMRSSPLNTRRPSSGRAQGPVRGPSSISRTGRGLTWTAIGARFSHRPVGLISPEPFSACTLELMPGIFPVVFFVSGALFVVEGGLSLARGRAVLVWPWEKRTRSTWEFWSQLLFGIAFILAAISMLPSPAQVPAALGAFLFSLGSLVGVILGIRSFRDTRSSPS